MLAGLALVWACGGDGATAPPPQPDPRRPTTVTVSPATAELTALGTTMQLAVEVHDQNDRVMAGVTVTWTSSASSVATVDASGLVTAVAEGMATITASAGSASGSAEVTVMQPVAAVQVVPAADTIGLGSTLELTAEGFDENGHAVEGIEFLWESSDAAIATVDASGLVTGVTVGAATITASAGRGQGTAEIIVMDLERAALVALYEVTDGPNWVNSENWLTEQPLGDWYGVDTNAAGRVIRLDLAGSSASEGGGPHGLSGTIPPELASLASLESLDLGYNRLSGPIPPELGSLASLRGLNLRDNRLSGTIPPELRNLASLVLLWIGDNGLSGTIPPELGNLANLKFLGLWSNDLSGPIPSELGKVTGLERVHLQRNNLTGPIPDSFLDLDGLELLRFERNADTCAPGTTSFVTWLKRIETVSGPYCNEADMKVLDLLYQTSGGPSWTNSTGWLETPALEEWYGVTANALGRVVALDLARNGLVGELPASLGDLTEMTALRVEDNSLAGRLPLSLARLSLVELRYNETGLCTPPEASFDKWLNGIASHEGTGVACAPLSDREVLVALYDATDGPNWRSSDNWPTDSPLRDWYGVTTDTSGRVVGLSLGGNNLSGPIPPELGNLASLRLLNLSVNSISGAIPPELGNLVSLEWLSLVVNDLSGPIPPELGSLTSLRTLHLGRNDLSGIPPELGNLASLTTLNLRMNQLTGPIPAELGDLTGLKQLRLSDNDLISTIPSELVNLSNLMQLDLGYNALAGPVPPTLGDLGSLEQLDLGGNALTGPIPAELGDLSRLRELELSSNNLTGSVPPELGGVSRLRQLSVANNPGLSGALPASLTDLGLDALLAGGTALCAPEDTGFQAWLQTIHKRWITNCASVGASMAYLTQTVQSRENPVPLVAGKRALLRIFITSAHPVSGGIPPVRAKFYLNGAEGHVVDIPAKTTLIPMEVVEGDLSRSANVEIPGEILQPGLEMVIEIDPDGTLHPDLGVAKRIPETGRMPLEVHEMPAFDLTVIPFLWSAHPNREIVEITAAMEADPEGHELLWDTRTLLPVGDLTVTAHDPVLSSTNDSYALFDETQAIRALEGSSGYYMGMMSGTVAGPGLGGGYRVSFARPDPFTIAHELGHNMSLQHAPCGGPSGVDPSFPYPDGSTGVWGYNSSDGGNLVHPNTPDLMSYCRDPAWVSDYHFTNALRFRLFDESPPLAASLTAQEAESLLLWGGMDAEGAPFFNPSFVVDAPSLLPNAPGEHRITGRSTSGDELFSLDFAMPEVADGDGSSSFAFVRPVEPGWANSLESITLSGPGGSVTLDGDTDIPMAILLDASTGQVRGILRDLPQADAAAALAPQAAPESLDVLFSRGIPDAAAWSR